MEAPNEKILKYNDMKKWDVCLMNPPYGDKQGKGYDLILHIKFVNKCLDVCNNIVCIMPFMFAKDKTNAKEYRNKISKRLVYVSEVDSSEFIGTNFANTAIYVFNKNEKGCEINGKSYKSLIEYDNMLYDNDYILNYIHVLLNKNNIITNKSDYCMLCAFIGKYDSTKVNKNDDSLLSNYISSRIDISVKNKNAVYLVMTTALGTKKQNVYGLLGGNGGKVFTTYEELKTYIITNKNTSGYHVLCFNNNISVKNFLIAVTGSVLRFPLTYLKKDFNITKNCYVCIPNIDWSDPRVVTDEGLLEVCGCPKDKCKEYAEYCRKYMEEFDKQHQSKKNKKK